MACGFQGDTSHPSKLSGEAGLENGRVQEGPAQAPLVLRELGGTGVLFASQGGVMSEGAASCLDSAIK